MTKFLLASIFFFTSFLLGAGQVCEPCEENTRCKIAFTFQYTSSGLDQLIWSIGGIDAAVCHTRSGNTCELYPDFKGVVFSTIEKQSDLMTTNIQFTADRNNQLIAGKKWELVNSSTVVYTCDVHYYKKIDQAMCHHKISKKGLHIECTSANVYPKSCCNFNVKVNRASWDLHLSPQYNHTVVKADPVYFDTVCALDIAPADLESGFWEFNVTMYPDIFNDDGKNCEPTNGGKTFLFNITIEHPVISLYNCPNAVDDGKEFNCICQLDDKSDVHTVVYWKKQGANRNNYNISAVLIATAKKEETGFTCIAENVIGWKTIFNYNISIFDYNCIARNEFGWATAIQYNPKIKEQTHTDVKIVIIPYVSVAILVILLCLNVFLVFDLRKQTEQVKLLAHFSHPKNYTKRIHNQGQKNIKDVAATCNKQPEEIDVCEESLID